jgi:lactoylglutathione lyase
VLVHRVQTVFRQGERTAGSKADTVFHHQVNDGCTGFSLELTWLRDHTEAYELGENESHLCLRVAGDYDEVRKFHKEMGCVCFENEQMGLYFINDPDDYWIEILPLK